MSNIPDEIDALFISRFLLALGEIGITTHPQEWIVDGENEINFKELKSISEALRTMATVLIGTEK